MKKSIHGILALGVSILILYLLYRRVDVATCAAVFETASYRHLLTVMGMMAAVYLLSAWRWLAMARVYCRISYVESLTLILSSSALNAILPSKLGSFAKAYFLNRRGHVETKAAVSLVIYERLADLAAMSGVFLVAAAWCRPFPALVGVTVLVAVAIVLGFIMLHVVRVSKLGFVVRAGRVRGVAKIVEWADVLYLFHVHPDISAGKLVKIHAMTLALWLCHAAQMVYIFRFLDLRAPAITIVAYMFCSLFVGLLPISVAGVGTRDLAIVQLFQGILTYPQAVVVGAITTLVRYIIPTLIGIPFLAISGSWRIKATARPEGENPAGVA